MLRWLNATKFTKEAVEKLPEHYKNFRLKYETEIPKPVHFKPVENYYENINGEMKRFENVTIPLKFPPESHLGLWGGEGIVKGFKKKSRFRRKVAHWWFPTLKKSVVYSEILDKYLEVTVTERTLKLIDDHTGFDKYILETRPVDMQSQLALDIRRKMLLALVREDLYPNDPAKKKEILDKYREHIIPEEEAEWWGLSFKAALEKQKKHEENLEVVPFKDVYRMQLIMKLQAEKDNPKQEENKDIENIFSKLNPFKR